MPSKLDSLTGLRALLAGMVLVAHACLRVGWLEGPGWVAHLASQLGHFGVIGFFILSGLILRTVYGQRPWTIREFAGNRFARIYPLYLCGLLFTLPIDWFSPGFAPIHKEAALGLNAVTLQAWFGFANGRFNGPGWSVEVFFYACFPALLLLQNRSKAAFAGLGVMLFVVTAMIWDPGGFATSYRFPAWRLWEFMLGMSVADLMVRLPKPGNWCWALALTVLFAALLLGGTVLWVPGWHFAGWVLMAAGACACIVLLGAADVQGTAWRPLSSPQWVLGGEISYGVYLFHDGAQRYAKVAVERALATGIETTALTVKLGYMIGTTVATVGMAYICWKWLEMPARVKLRAIFGKAARGQGGVRA